MATKVKLIADGVITPDQITLTTASTGTNTTAPATTAFVQQEISALVDSSPEALNTLNELAAALGDDANFSTTVTNSIATKAPLATPQFTNRVGIGVAAHATGALNITNTSQHIRLNNGSELGIISLLSTGELELWGHGDGESINFRTGSGSGTVAMNVVGTNVGIGTDSPFSKLSINSNGAPATSAGNMASTGLTVHNGTGGTAVQLGTYDAGSWGYIQSGYVNNATVAREFRIMNGANYTMTLTNTGNVGIGTTNPSEILHMNNTTGTGCFIRFQNTGGSGVYIGGRSEVMEMYTNGSEKMRISSSGCVGVGSTVDRSLGTNIGTLVVNGSAGGGLWLSTGNSSATTSKIYSITDGSVGELIINQGGSNGGTIKFTHNQSSTPTLALLSNGVHLFNTASQSGISNGTSNIACGSLGQGQLVLATNNDTPIILNRANGSGTMVTIRNNGSTVGSISQNGTSTSYNTSSDYRLKENISYEFNALDRVAQLRPARFNFIADADTTVDGFLAHEVQDIVPEAILGEKDAVDSEDNPEYQVIDQSKLVPLLTKAIQELSAKLEAAEARITELEG